MDDFDKYVERSCRNGKYSEDEFRESAMAKEVEKYYEELERDKQAQHII